MVTGIFLTAVTPSRVKVMTRFTVTSSLLEKRSTEALYPLTLIASESAVTLISDLSNTEFPFSSSNLVNLGS